MLWLLISIGVAIFIYKVLIKPFNHWKELGVPQNPFWIIWKDTLLSVTQQIALTDTVIKMYSDFSDYRYSGLYQFSRPLLGVNDPDLIKQITVKDFDHFVDHSVMVPEDTEPLWEKNLLSLKGDKWRDMRSTLSPSFTSSKMKFMFGLISDCAKEFTKYFEEQNLPTVEIEMKGACTRFTNDVIASAVFGVNCNSMREPNNDFYTMGREITSFTGLWKNLKFIIVILAPKIAKVLGLTGFDKKVGDFFKSVVKDNIQTREREGIIRPDMIHLLMEARKERSKNEKPTEEITDMGFATVDEPSLPKEEKRKKAQITDEDITAQALIFFFAGFETVSSLMCFMAHELAVNVEVQELLQKEIDDTLEDCQGTLSYEALSTMKYMDMVVSESLRKWPIAVAMDRLCVKPYTIQPVKEGEKPVHLKKGDMVSIPVFGLHRSPKLYPEPERFNPERFSDENKSNIVPYTYLPFGSGPRSCIGNRFALMETKLVFFHILSKFDITVVEKTKVPLKLATGFQLTADGGFWLGLKRRQAS